MNSWKPKPTKEILRFINKVQYHEWGVKPFPWRHGNHEPNLSVEELMDHGISVRNHSMNVKTFVLQKKTIK